MELLCVEQVPVEELGAFVIYLFFMTVCVIACLSCHCISEGRGQVCNCQVWRLGERSGLKC